MTQFTGRDVATERDIIDAADRLRQRRERALDELAIARLRASRLNALEAIPSRRRFWRLAGGAATAGLALSLAGIVWFQAPSELSIPQGTETTVADLDLLATESPEFYTDLEFYRWLASQSDAS